MPGGSKSSNGTFMPYAYTPSIAAAGIFSVLFALTTLLHTYQMFRTRAWFMTPFILGGLGELIGYVARAYSASESPGPYTQDPYIVQTICIIVAPTLLAATIYMELGRIVLMLRADAQLFIRRTWLTKIFVGGDVISFLTQAAGAAMLSSGENVSSGQNIILVGLFVQLIFFGLFVAAAGVFHARVLKNPTGGKADTMWKEHMYALYAVSVMVFVRSLVRVVEFVQGAGGYIGSHEVFLYVFDALLMFLAMGILNWIHPGKVAEFNREGKFGSVDGDVETGYQSVPMIPERNAHHMGA